MALPIHGGQERGIIEEISMVNNKYNRDTINLYCMILYHTINSLWVVFIYTKASSYFNNLIGRDDKHCFIGKEIKFIELK